jgi:hypothetical protein
MSKDICRLCVCFNLLLLFLCGCGASQTGPAPPKTTLASMPDFTLSLSVPGVNLNPGAAATVSISIVPVNALTSAVTLALSGLPAEITASPSAFTVAPGSTPPISQPISLTATTSAAIATWPLSITATSGAVSHSAQLAVSVTSPTQQTPPPTGAETYYVNSASGNDGSDGMSQATAWKTIAKVNLATFHAGDQVLFYTAGVWHEELDVLASGTAQAPIVFSSYGPTGKKPTIDGADVVTGWNLLKGTTYQAIYRAEALKAFVDALYTQTIPLTRRTSVAAVESTPGSIYSDGTYVYANLADGSNPDLHTVEVSGSRFYNIVATSRNYLVFNGFQLVRAARSGLLANSNVDNSTGNITNEYITVQNLTIFNWGNTAGKYATDGGAGGIYVWGLPSHTQRSLRGWLVQANNCGRADTLPVLTYHVGCIDVEGTVSAVITMNTVASINSLGITTREYYSGDPCRSPTISNNDVSNSQGNLQVAGCPNAIVQNNTIHDSYGYGIGVGGNGDPSHPVGATGVQLINNTITNLGPSADKTLYNGVDCNTGASGGTASGNRISAVAGNNITLEADSYISSIQTMPCSGWQLINNVFDSSHNTMQNGGAPGRTGPVYIRDASLPGLWFQNNTYILHPNYPNGMMYGFKSAADWDHDYTLTQFGSTAPNAGGINSDSH